MKEKQDDAVAVLYSSFVKRRAEPERNFNKIKKSNKYGPPPRSSPPGIPLIGNSNSVDTEVHALGVACGSPWKVTVVRLLSFAQNLTMLLG